MPIPTLDELYILHRNICYAIADPKRLQILYALDEAPRHVGALAEALAMPQPTVSRHLGILRERDLVVGERDGSMVVYRLGDERIIGVLAIMRSILTDLLEQQANKLS